MKKINTFGDPKFERKLLGPAYDAVKREQMASWYELAEQYGWTPRSDEYQDMEEALVLAVDAGIRYGVAIGMELAAHPEKWLLIDAD